MRLDFAALWNVPTLAIARVASGLLRHWACGNVNRIAVALSWGRAAASHAPPFRGLSETDTHVWTSESRACAEAMSVPSARGRGGFGSVVRRKFSWGRLVQGHMVVICIWCALSVTSQFDVISMFPNLRFGKVCW